MGRSARAIRAMHQPVTAGGSWSRRGVTRLVLHGIVAGVRTTADPRKPDPPVTRVRSPGRKVSSIVDTFGTAKSAEVCRYPVISQFAGSYPFVFLLDQSLPMASTNRASDGTRVGRHSRGS